MLFFLVYSPYAVTPNLSVYNHATLNHANLGSGVSINGFHKDSKNLHYKEYTYEPESFDLIINNTVITHSLVVEDYSNVLLTNSIFNVSGFNNIIVKGFGKLVLDNVTFLTAPNQTYSMLNIYGLEQSVIVFLSISLNISELEISLIDNAEVEFYPENTGEATINFRLGGSSLLTVSSVNFTNGFSVQIDDSATVNFFDVSLVSGSGYFGVSGGSSLNLKNFRAFASTNFYCEGVSFISVEDSLVNSSVTLNMHGQSYLYMKNVDNNGSLIVVSYDYATEEIYSSNISSYIVYWDSSEIRVNSFYSGFVNASFIENMYLYAPRMVYLYYSSVESLYTYKFIYRNGSVIDNDIIIGEWRRAVPSCQRFIDN